MDTASPISHPFTVGTHWVFSLSAWLIGGTVASATEEFITLSEGVWLESVKQGYATQSDVALSTSPKEMDNIITSCYPLPPGHVLRVEAIFHASPSVQPMTVLYRRRQSAAIKAAK